MRAQGCAPSSGSATIILLVRQLTLATKIIPLDNESHRLRGVRFMANGVLLGTRFGELRKNESLIDRLLRGGR